MFAVAKPGMPANKLTVTDVLPPSGEKRFTSVRLTARSSMATGHVADKKKSDGGKKKSERKPDRRDDKRPARIYTFAAPVAESHKPVITCSVKRGEALIAEVRNPVRASGMAELKRALAVKAASGDDRKLTVLIGVLAERISMVKFFDQQEPELRARHDAKEIEIGLALNATRKQKIVLDGEHAFLRKETARYASLCSKLKRLGDNAEPAFKTEVEEIGVTLVTVRAALKLALERNKKEDEDLDFALHMAITAATVEPARSNILATCAELANLLDSREVEKKQIECLVNQFESTIA